MYWTLQNAYAVQAVQSENATRSRKMNHVSVWFRACDLSKLLFYKLQNGLNVHECHANGMVKIWKYSQSLKVCIKAVQKMTHMPIVALLLNLEFQMQHGFCANNGWLAGAGTHTPTQLEQLQLASVNVFSSNVVQCFIIVGVVEGKCRYMHMHSFFPLFRHTWLCIGIFLEFPLQKSFLLTFYVSTTMLDIA